MEIFSASLPGVYTIVAKYFNWSQPFSASPTATATSL